MADTTESLQQQLARLLAEAEAAVAGAGGVVAVENLRVQYLGKKGLLTEQLKQVGGLSPDDRPRVGKWVNDAKERLSERLRVRKTELEAAAQQVKVGAERIDVTLPGRGMGTGGLHPITRTLDRVATIFRGMGFVV